MRAVRNVKLCTKDCLCLYVCPTGATNTETGQIDADKCLDGCRLCVDACTSHAISLIPRNYPAQQEKTDDVCADLNSLAESKLKQEAIAKALKNVVGKKEEKAFLEGLAMSNRVMAEDIMREAGFLLPQSDTVKNLLTTLLEKESDPTFPKDAVEKLLKLL